MFAGAARREVAHWVGGAHGLVVGRRQREPDHGHDGVQDEREKCVFVQGDALATQTPAGGDREAKVLQLEVVRAVDL